MKKITLFRKRQLNDKGRKYRIFIDDEFIDEIRYDDDHKVINIPSGGGKLKIKIDWCSSNKIDLSLENGNNFQVSSSLKDNVFLFIIIGIILSVILYFISNMLIFATIPLVLILYPVYLITFGMNNYLKITRII